MLKPVDILKLAAEHLNISEAQIQTEIDFYNRDYSAYGNDIYSQISTRVAHWLNYCQKDWFTRRVDLYLDKLVRLDHPLLIDIGFSIPYASIRYDLAERTDLAVLLVDKEPSAGAFYEIIEPKLPLIRRRKDRVLVANVETDQGRKEILSAATALVAENHVRSVLLVASEVLEHLGDPSSFWKLAREVEASTTQSVLVYVTLPVGEKIPSHVMSFRTEVDALGFLGTNLDIAAVYTLRPPDMARMSPALTACVCVFGTVRH